MHAVMLKHMEANPPLSANSPDEINFAASKVCTLPLSSKPSLPPSVVGATAVKISYGAEGTFGAEFIIGAASLDWDVEVSLEIVVSFGATGGAVVIAPIPTPSPSPLSAPSSPLLPTPSPLSAPSSPLLPTPSPLSTSAASSASSLKNK